MIIPNLYMFDPYTLETTIVRAAQVIGTQVLTKNSFGTITPTGVYKEGYSQVWKHADVVDWKYKNEETSIASAGDDGGWYYIEDHRGLEYWLPTDTYDSQPTIHRLLGALPKDIVTIRPAKTLDDHKREILELIDSKYQTASNKLLEGYPTAESSSWTRQEQEARAYLKNKKSDVPYLTILAETRDISLVDLANKIVINADEYLKTSAKLLGLRHKYLDRYKSLTDMDSVTALKNDIDYTV